jgi:hypothetical protein
MICDIIIKAMGQVVKDRYSDYFDIDILYSPNASIDDIRTFDTSKMNENLDDIEDNDFEEAYLQEHQTKTFLLFNRSALRRSKIVKHRPTQILLNSKQYKKHFQLKDAFFGEFDLEFTLISNSYQNLEIFETGFYTNLKDYMNLYININIDDTVEQNFETVFNTTISDITDIELIDYETLGGLYKTSFTINFDGLIPYLESQYYPKLLKIIKNAVFERMHPDDMAFNIIVTNNQDKDGVIVDGNVELTHNVKYIEARLNYDNKMK